MSNIKAPIIVLLSIHLGLWFPNSSLAATCARVHLEDAFHLKEGAEVYIFEGGLQKYRIKKIVGSRVNLEGDIFAISKKIIVPISQHRGLKRGDSVVIVGSSGSELVRNFIRSL
ncbi:MAG: hypothetical protein AB7H97_16440 [Pseudobdellovibrionaceae bacterium]